MGDWVIIDFDSGNPEQILSVNNKADFEEAGWYKGTGKIAVDLPSNYSRQDILETSYWEQSELQWKTRSAKPTGFYVWTDAKKWELDRDMVMATLRAERNMRLAECDWTQTVDAPFTDEKKAEWVTYRQALRDITKDVSATLDTLVGFNWPTQPS